MNPMNKNGKQLFVFVGSYAEPNEAGIKVYAFHKENGTLTLLDEVYGLKNPTFLNIDAPNRRLYSIAETVIGEGKKAGEAAAFSIDPEMGRLTELNRVLTTDATTCHIQRDEANRYLVVASYHGGKVGLVSLSEDGRVGELLDVQQHVGHGSNPERQDRPHPHSSFFSPDERYLFVPDLGIDRICTYTIDSDRHVLQLHGETKTHPGAGPRHMTFHPNGRYAYVINEVDSTITAFRYAANTGELREIATISTIPEEFAGENTCAEIVTSRDGRFLYGSNRGHDSIAVYAINEQTGALTLVEHVSTEGEHPRHFALIPDGTHMIVANRDTNNIVTFCVDQETGKLKSTGHSVSTSKPVCIQPFYLLAENTLDFNCVDKSASVKV